MANNKSAKKRIKTNARKTIENNRYKTLMRSFTKDYFTALTIYKQNPTQTTRSEAIKQLSLAYSGIDTASKKHIIHKNTANRKKSRLAKAMSKKLIESN